MSASVTAQGVLPLNRRPRSLTERLLSVNLWLVFFFFYAPILVLVIFSFNSSRMVS